MSRNYITEQGAQLPLSAAKNWRRDRHAPRTLSTASPNSTARTSPRSATGIPSDAQAYRPVRDGELRGPACSTAFPQLLPIPQPGRHPDRQRESHLMRKHTDLSAMVSFVGQHVAQHFHAHRPRPRPAIPPKLFDAAVAQRFRQHLRAARRALRQSHTRLLRRAVRAVELSWNLKVRSGKPHPLGAGIVHMREDRRNGARLPGRFRFPRGRVKMFDKNLVHPLVGSKYPDRRPAELCLNLRLTRGHGFRAPRPNNTSEPTPHLRRGSLRGPRRACEITAGFQPPWSTLLVNSKHGDGVP